MSKGKERLEGSGPSPPAPGSGKGKRGLADAGFDPGTLLAAITGATHDAVLCKDLEGTILSWNRGAELMYGYSAEEAVGRDISLIVPEGREHELPDIFARLARGETIDELETVRMTKDGRRVDITLTISPITVDDEVVAALAIARDVSDFKRAEQALREADRRKNEFLAVLGHELRNPLAPLRNALEILEEPAATREQQENVLETAGRQVDRLARLVDDLLDVARISRGKVLLRKENVDLGEIVQEVMADHASIVEEQGLAASLEMPDRPVPVHGDPTRLAQAFGNVLRNAVKFSDTGTISVRLTVDDGQAVVTVRDEGVGMDGDTLASLFDPGGTGPAEGRTGQRGLGLGLSVTRDLIELHGGRISAASEGPGQGSEFTLRLPLVDAPIASPTPSPGAGTGESGTRKILIVEDNSDAAESLRTLLELRGHDVEVARDGRTGIERAASFRPDLVLCDLGLPGECDGYAVATALREDRALSDVVLIALSGYGREEDRARAREAGFDTHVTKPVSIDDLDRLICRDSNDP